MLGLRPADGRLNPNFHRQFRRQAVRSLHLRCLRHVRLGDDELRLSLPAEAIARRLEAVGVDERPAPAGNAGS